METLFKILLRKKIKSTDKEEIIRLFLINSKGTLHNKTVTKEEEKSIKTDCSRKQIVCWQ